MIDTTSQDNKIEKDFRNDFKALLDKYNAFTYYETRSDGSYETKEVMVVHFNKVQGTNFDHWIDL